MYSIILVKPYRKITSSKYDTNTRQIRVSNRIKYYSNEYIFYSNKIIYYSNRIIF